MIRSLTLIIAVMLIPIAAQAAKGLTFDSERKSLNAKAEDKKITVKYSFENTAKRVITIARWDSACSCLGARIKDGKMEYKPGEKGEIEVDFELGGFSGTQEKTIMLWTKDDTPQAPSTVLAVNITIPVLFELSPKSLAWDQHGSNEPKTIKVKVHDKKPIHITADSGTNSSFPYSIKTIRKGWEYEITVTPKDVTLPSLGMIKLTTDSPIKRYQRQQAFVYVKSKAK